MRKIIFSCKWQKNHITSWSGTHNAIYSRLQKYYEVVNFDTGFFNLRPASLRMRIRKRLGLPRPRNIYLWNIEHCNRIARRRFRRGEYVCVQFDECPNLPNIKSFIFQDFCAGYTKRAMDECGGAIYPVSGAPTLRRSLSWIAACGRFTRRKT